MIRYKYPPAKIIFPYAVFLLVPALGAFAMIKTEFGIAEFGLISLFFWSFNLAFAAPVIIWIVNNLSMRIELTGDGLRYTSYLKSRDIKWRGVRGIERAILYERRGWHDNPLGANDLLMRFDDGAKLKIYGIVHRCDGKEGGIEEFEAIVRDRTNIQQPDPECQKAKELGRQSRLAMVAGVLCVVMGIIMLQRPLPPNLEKFGFVTRAIGISGDGLVLAGGGLWMVWWGFRASRKGRY